MNRYQRIKKLGDGTYGEVYLAQISDTNEIVAIKKMKRKYYSWDECLKLREIEALRKLSHPNIIKLKEVIRENDELFMIFEYMKENLYDYLKRKVKLNNATVKHVTYQMLQGLKGIHQKGFFHRDMKPENLLLNDNGQEPPTVKVADFGLARNIRSKPPYTDYVSTRWYRAPEVLLQSRNYSAPIDIWAVGCIVPELFTGRPLFPGSSEIDQLHKLCSILGTFSQQDWPEGCTLSKQKFPSYNPVALETIIPSAEPSAIQLIEMCLKWNPAKRAKAADLLNCSWFSNMRVMSFPNTNPKSAGSGLGHHAMGGPNSGYPIPTKTAESGGRRPMQGAAAVANLNRNAQTHPSGDLGSSQGMRNDGDARPHAPPTFGESRPQIDNKGLKSKPQQSKNAAKLNLSDDFDDDDEFASIFNMKPEKRQRTDLASLFGSQKEPTSLSAHKSQLPPINSNSRRDSAQRYYDTHARYKPQQNSNQGSQNRGEFRDLSSGNSSSFLSSFNNRDLGGPLGGSNPGNSNPTGGGYKPGFGNRRDSHHKQTFIAGTPPSTNKPLINPIGGSSLIDKYHPLKF